MNVFRMFACGVVFTMAAAAVPSSTALAFAGVQDQDHDRDSDHRNAEQRQGYDPSYYANNTYYKMGYREGTEDYKRRKQRKEHNHKYREDEDRRAHDYGYQQGWQGPRNDDNVPR
jgi:hypothetical protein